eukprot:CAMPEP_0170934680 /NCGR_PEP_ID=MMETSP0735-20130129/18529_1 /TAXON_ID=186038 /ORGANISM="Fragilariopsis kerguelensis, Strain L26-C5" /LENGTH=448 /DNA_ID=CAMNT_0011338009 /DNA_START=100 /DNA_END=1446 /DNA_ORIENTATION=+
MMKFITPTLFATLFVVGASEDPVSPVAPTFSPTVKPRSEPYECQDEDLGNMDEFMIGKVGKTSDDKSFPFGKVFFTDEAGKETEDGNPHKLVASIYLEFDEDKLEEDEEGNSLLNLVGGFQQVYVNVPGEDKDCGARGIPLDKSDWHHGVIRIREYNYAKFYTPIDTSTCFPSTKQGQVARVNVVIKDPLKEGHPIVTENNIIDFCYRVGYTIGEGDTKTLVSFTDTKVHGVVTVEGIFGTFDQAVEIVGPDATEIDTSVRTEVDVEVFLCNNKNVGTDNVKDRQYQIGQNFRLCVKSSNDKYEVTEFKDVSCGTRQLVSEGVAFDELSNIYLLNEKGDLVEDSIAVKSVITATIITEGTRDGSILCQGEVTLKKIDGTIVERNLQEVSSGSEADDDELLQTPFDLTLNLATPNVNLNNSIESSASLPSSITTTTAVAVIGFVVALFL